MRLFLFLLFAQNPAPAIQMLQQRLKLISLDIFFPIIHSPNLMNSCKLYPQFLSADRSAAAQN